MPLLSTFQWLSFSFPEFEFFKTGYLLNVTYSVKNGLLAANQMFFASAGIKIRIQYSLIKIFDYQGNEKDFLAAANPFAQYLFFSQF
jgi:hypothetical protein